MSCRQKQDYIPEECLAHETIVHTDKLKISDTLPSFYPLGKEKLSFKDLNNERTFIFFKKEKINAPSLLNDEINYEGFKKLVGFKNVDVIALSEYKIAKVYGIKLTHEGLTNSFLFIADKNHVIQKIYKGVCEEDIVEILNQLQTSPNKK